ncbi:MAG: hypothetical protein IKN25_07000 [Spirochaetales bacterium]|nr:hypothetical protein [Spirochaetales bacterium]
MSFSLFGQDMADNQSDTTADLAILQNEDDNEQANTQKSFLFAKNKPGYQYRIGIGNALSVVYYRRSFGMAYEVFADIRLVRGLFLESGIKMMIYHYSVTHFFPITVQMFENYIHGSYGAFRVALKYRFDLLEHFGLLISSGFMVGLGVYTCMDYIMSNTKEMITCAGLELSPEFTIGATIPFGKYRIDISCFKWLPIIPVHFNYNDRSWRNYKDFQQAGGAYSPMRPICWSAMGVSISFTYFLK